MYLIIPLNSGRTAVNGSDFYIGNSSNTPCQLARLDQVPAGYTHPVEKQCNYSYIHPSSQQCSNVNATTLDGHPASYFATAASNLQMGYVEYVGTASGTSDEGQTIQINPNARLVIVSVQLTRLSVGASNGCRPHYAVLTTSYRNIGPGNYGTVTWSGSSITVVSHYSYGGFYGFNTSDTRYIIIYFY